MRTWYAAIALLGLGLRAADVFRRSLQVDEGLTLYLGGLRVPDALTFLRQHDVHPPLLTLAIHALLWMHFPDWLIRVVFVLMGTASVVLAMAIVRLWTDDRAAALAGLFAACMPLLIFNDSMVRMYAPFDAVALLSFYLLSLVLVKPELPVLKRRAIWIGWTLCAAAMLYLLYAAFFVVAAELAYALVVRRDAALKMLAGCAFALVVWLPQYATFAAQLPGGGLAFPEFAGRDAEMIASLPEQATLQIPYQSVMGWILAAAVWLWAGAALTLTIRSDRRSVLPWIAAPALLTLIYSLAAHKLLYTDRYYTLYAYALCCWTGVTLAQARRARAAFAPVAACVIIAAVAIQNVTDVHHSTADWKSIGGLLRAQSQRHDLFVFEQGSPVWVLGRAGVLEGHPLLLVFRNDQTAGSVAAAKPFRRIWYVGFQAWPVDRTGTVLTNLRRRYRLVRYWRFDDAMASESVLVVFFQGVSRAPH